MTYTVRPVRSEEWPLAREIRLAALQDPDAHLAFLDTYEAAVARPEQVWRDRCAAAEEGRTVRQFIGQDAAGRWLGTVTVLVELPGDEAAFGGPPSVPQAHIVGVYVRPEARGSGLAEELFRAAVAWSWALPEPRVERVRLYTHEKNLRAQAFYAKVGFVPSGVTVPVPGDESAREIELVAPRG
ncbi:RimJ/RimL family protein N-acetyltransferase [Kitasatospora sp. MAA4]|uniref:GNAT family N-acetyltransferase n=1 Tax=Kitasatospora sp. MAA4 TaxID=3035093 RepID=UPI0024733CE6|nr:GNAT family N-acetyltransferase [Kitasatospora sp. MAA4]MDH6132778.1 RimJ/RimL family protein N-acetyltransferase [Kitasatospora sp. MAA4]